MRSRIALVTHSRGGGVWTVTRFLQQVLERQGTYQINVFMLATSARDPASVRLFAPTTWRSAPRTFVEQYDGSEIRRVGSVLAEFEFQRYRPRAILTELLNRYDLVQVIAGTPAWAFAVHDVRKPVVLVAASLA